MRTTLLIILFVLLFESNIEMSAKGTGDFIPFQDPAFDEKERPSNFEDTFYENGSESDNPPSLRTPPPAGVLCPKCGSHLDPVTGACLDEFERDCTYVYDGDSGLGTPITDGLYLLLLYSLIYATILSQKKNYKEATA